MEKHTKSLLREIFKCCLTVIIFLVINGYTAFATDVSVWPKEIKFDYDRNSSTYDALTIKEDASDQVAVPEWQKDVRSNEIAYIKGNSNRKIQVSFDANCTDMHLLINLTVTSGTGIGTVCNYFVDNYEKLDFITLTLSGSIPSTVGERSFTWSWEVYAIPIGSAYCPATSTNSTSHTYYTLYSNPNAPMAEPWVDALEYACDWASGESSSSSIVSSLTNELYDCGITYDPSQHYTAGSYDNIDLTSLLDDLSTPSSVYMDCRDFANFMQVLGNALGLSLTYSVIDNTSSPYYFCYNYLLPANWASGDMDCWNFHQVAMYGSYVVDAAAQLDADADPTSPPHTWVLVDGDWTFSSYESNLSNTSLSIVGSGTCSVY